MNACGFFSLGNDEESDSRGTVARSVSAAASMFFFILLNMHPFV